MNSRCILLIILLFGFSGPSLFAQRPLDAKKKKNAGVSTASLHAKQINGKASARQSITSGFNNPNTFNYQPGRHQPHRVIHSAENGLPLFIETRNDPSSARAAVRKDAHTGSLEYLKDLHDVLKIESPETEFVVQRIQTDPDRKSHVRLNQVYKNIPVYGAEVIVHLNEFGQGEAFNGRYIDVSRDIDVVPAISGQYAIEKIKANTKNARHALSAMERSLVQYADPVSTLYVYEDKGLVKSQVLAYHIVYCPSLHERLEYFVDAHNGNILNHFNSTCYVDGPRTGTANDLNAVSRTINTYQKGTTFFLLDVSKDMFNAANSSLPDDPVGGILTIDMNGTFGDNTVINHITSLAANTWNAKSVSAHFNAGFAYSYYLTNHSRNSIDDVKGTIISIINVPDETGQPLDNAFWNGKAMFYGNGDVGFKPLAGSLDVAGHEMTHGVVQHTANLEYQGESGAINESMADIFGSMMDPTDYLIGEDVVKAAAFPSGALRSLADPHNGGNDLSDPGFQPMHVNEKFNGNEDNGGVHINSGITNHAFFLYAEAITRDKAADVFYKALKDYLTKSSQFIDLRLAVIKAAGDLFGAASNEVTQAGVAFNAVGIVDGQGGNYEDTLPTNPGAEYILVTNTDTGIASSLFRILSSNTNQQTPLTTTKPLSRPSVTDDGSAAVFVAPDHTIHLLITDPNEDPQEVIIEEEEIWSNVVISKGGSRIAAVTTDNTDNHIYVYDFISAAWGEFELYNPTFSDGVTSGGPVYADALEWDYSGEYLVYDAFNRIENSDGGDIEYWDVNFMHVWNQETQDFSDGEVAKLFASLPDGVSIGNPSFSKNSPNVLVFDYVNEVSDEYAILGCNAETGDVGIIANNNALGYPTFNQNDTRVAFAEADGGGNTQSVYVVMNNDKINSNQIKLGLFAKTKWPVYFAAGTREIGDEVITSVNDDQKSASISCYPNPFTDEISMQFKEGSPNKNKIEIFDLMGRRVLDYSIDRSNGSNLSIKVPNLSPGQYVVRFQNGRVAGACKVVKHR